MCHRVMILQMEIKIVNSIQQRKLIVSDLVIISNFVPKNGKSLFKNLALTTHTVRNFRDEKNMKGGEPTVILLV